MNKLDKKNGAVFYVDILGFAVLTQNKIELKERDFAEWDIPRQMAKDNQALAATILFNFRDILFKYKAAYPDATIAQLSDCAFVWSENIRDVIIVACNLMWDCVKRGILCRGGLSCGEIIETSQKNDLGRLILGQAVSNAARLEASGAKGARIMVNDDVYGYLCKYDEDFHSRMNILFQPFENPLDFQIYDELKWYYIPNLDKDVPDLRTVDKEYMAKATCERIKLANCLRLNPRFLWNSKNKEGRNQLLSSIRFIAANEKTIFDVHHSFAWNNLIDLPTINSFNNMKRRIESESQQYKVLKDGTIMFPEPE